MPKKLNTMMFIEKSRRTHGERYTYDHAVYINATTKVLITCTEHGDFPQTPAMHMSGNGCPKCGYLWFTPADFLARAKAVHGEQYDYANSIYRGSNVKVIINCPKPGHGDFLQAPQGHLNGRGCPKCGLGVITQEEFIEQANAKHEGAYTYARVSYKGSKYKVTITCPAPGHGDFRQRAISHLHGQGCPKCGQISCHNTQRKGVNEFIRQADEKHSGKYAYSNVKYCGALKKVAITCPEHGDFSQKPNDHLQGYGCPKCAHNFQVTFHEFVSRARSAHGNNYTYEESGYEHTAKKATIICPKHGHFRQWPSDHMSGRGCPKCARVAPLTREEFIQRATEIHGGKYIYARAVYKNNHTKTTITCPVDHHRDFQQTPGNHLSGAGCPKCSESRGERAIDQILRSTGREFTREYRISECRYKRPLPFDFAVFNKGDLAALIEFHGEQHYETERFFGMSGNINKVFAVVQLRDSIKRDYCKANNIPLLEISFAKKNEARSMITHFLAKIKKKRSVA